VTLAAGAAKVYARRRRIASADGQLFFEAAEAAVYSNAATVATAVSDVGATISNATDKYLSGDFVFEVTTTGTPAGDAFLYLHRATDGGAAHWPDTTLGAVMVKLNFTAAGTKRIDFSL